MTTDDNDRDQPDEVVEVDDAQAPGHPCPGCGELGDEHEDRCLVVGCPGCGVRGGACDDDCPATWWRSWGEHRDGAPPIEPEDAD